jgi:signal transduction histidine kinase
LIFPWNSGEKQKVNGLISGGFECLNTFSPTAYWLCSGLTRAVHVQHGQAVWVGKPWVVPTAIIRTVTVIIVAIVFLFLEAYFHIFSYHLAVLPLWAWTSLVFAVIWLLSMLSLLVFWASNNYILRQDGLEIRRGIIRLHSFVVTPAGFGDLLVYQSVGGRIFGYGEITVNSQGERQTKLLLVRAPFAVADTIRDIMGKPIVRVDNRA